MSDLMKVGPDYGGTGTFKPFTSGITAAQRVADAHARYFEAARSGNAFSVSGAAAGFAAASTMVSPLAAGTGVPVAGIFNPNNSGVLAVVMLATVTIVYGAATPTIGVPVFNFIPPSAGITATGSAGLPANLGNATGSSKCRGFSNAALTGSPAATMLRPVAGNVTVLVNATANNQMSVWSEEVAGMIVVPPGAFLGIALSAAGTGETVNGALVWEEVPYLI